MLGRRHHPGGLAVGGVEAGVERPSPGQRGRQRTITVTNSNGSPLAEVADVVLCSTARRSPLLGENAAARVAQLTILDAIFVLVAQRDYAKAERNLSRTKDAVRGKRRN